QTNPSIPFSLNPPPPSDSSPLSLHDALPILLSATSHEEDRTITDMIDETLLDDLEVEVENIEFELGDNVVYPHHGAGQVDDVVTDRKSTRLNSSHDQISYAVFCLKKKKK